MKARLVFCNLSVVSKLCLSLPLFLVLTLALFPRTRLSAISLTRATELESWMIKSRMNLRSDGIGLDTSMISHFAACVPALYRGSEAVRQYEMGTEERRASGCDVCSFAMSIWKLPLPELLRRDESAATVRCYVSHYRRECCIAEHTVYTQARRPLLGRTMPVAHIVHGFLGG